MRRGTGLRQNCEACFLLIIECFFFILIEMFLYILMSPILELINVHTVQSLVELRFPLVVFIKGFISLLYVSCTKSLYH